MSIIIGIDHGYYAIKTAHCSFPAGLTSYGEHEPYTRQGLLEFGGCFFVCGSGRQPIQRDKTVNDNYYLLTLAAIAKEIQQRGLPPECSVRIAAGLPLTSFGRDKPKFKDYLLRSKQPVNFRFEGVEYSITIEEVAIFPQGYAALMTETGLLQDEPSMLLMDLGGWTVDLMRILTKFIDAKNNLSIQVHPSNEYALKNEHQYGKTEMWYVLDCEPGAFLYYGFDHEISKAEFEERIKNNTLTEVLNAVPVHKGDCFFIPAGTLHAICKGIVIAEVQQNSNVTYRVYDYGRVGADGKPRALHVEKALDVTLRTPPVKHDFGSHLAQGEYFTVDAKNGAFEDTADEKSFVSLLVTDGEGELTCGGETVVVKKGDSFFLPAGSGSYAVRGTCQTLVTRV